MPKRTQDYHSWLIKRLTEPREAERYLKVAIEDSPEMFLKALRNVAEAHKMAKVAERAGVNRESLYRTLSEEGNPRYGTLISVLESLGVELTVKLKNRVSLPTPVSANELPNLDVTFRTTSGADLRATVTFTNAGHIPMEYSSTPVPAGISNPNFPLICLIAEKQTSSAVNRIKG